MVHHLALINKLRRNKFTYNRAVQRARKVISLLLTLFLAHSVNLILVLQYSEYLIFFVFFLFLFFFAAERFEILFMFQSICDVSAVQSPVC